MKGVMVDTEIWSIAKKKPDENKFASREEFTKVLEMHKRAKVFFMKIFPRLKVYMAVHQLAEIYHVLAFRGTRIPKSHAENIVRLIIEDDNIVKVAVTLEHIEEAIKESVKSNIHVWDYLCFIPVKDYIDTVFTCDEHFIRIGKKYNIRIINPLNTWITI